MPTRIVLCLICLVCCPLLLCVPCMTNKSSRWFHTCSNCNQLVAVRLASGIVEVKEPLPPKMVPSKYGAVRDQSEAESGVAEQKPAQQK